MNYYTLLSVASRFFDRRMFGRPRNPKWYAESRQYLLLHPACVVCLQLADTVHHIKPVHASPELEMVQSNWASVCNRCHFVVGHNCNWRKWAENFWIVVHTINAGVRA